MVSESSIQIQTSGEGEVDDRTFSKQPGKENKNKKSIMCNVIYQRIELFWIALTIFTFYYKTAISKLSKKGSSTSAG